MVKSIWGSGDKEITQLIHGFKPRGVWLNLAAGDGRYSDILLKYVDKLAASDIDKNALNKLRSQMPEKYKSKLMIKIFNFTKKFPFKNEVFNGVFCTGSLHLFPQKVLGNHLFQEIDRVLKPHGTVILDFATNIKRVLPDGSLKRFENERDWKVKPASEFLKQSFKNYAVKITTFRVFDDLTRTKGLGYKFYCDAILMLAKKKNI